MRTPTDWIDYIDELEVQTGSITSTSTLQGAICSCRVRPRRASPMYLKVQLSSCSTRNFVAPIGPHKCA
ncbi:hypothetical protein BGW80DRAFT_1286497 [Lactifluus volemus]|nr:hypothetical protein BGW80DRAFT_1286497 [Lactifluus volemus]